MCNLTTAKSAGLASRKRSPDTEARGKVMSRPWKRQLWMSGDGLEAQRRWPDTAGPLWLENRMSVSIECKGSSGRRC